MTDPAAATWSGVAGVTADVTRPATAGIADGPIHAVGDPGRCLLMNGGRLSGQGT